MFTEVGKTVQQKEITKLIFDKQSLRVFDHESMEWYFTQWKEEMCDYGLVTYRKIMPKNLPFKYSVDLARNSIFERYPNGKFHQMDIRYVGSLAEGIAQ